MDLNAKEVRTVEDIGDPVPDPGLDPDTDPDLPQEDDDTEGDRPSVARPDVVRHFITGVGTEFKTLQYTL